MSLFRLTEKLLECNKYISQLEAQNKLLHDNLLLTAQNQRKSEQQKYENRKRQFLRPIHEMADYIDHAFEFRHDVIRDTYEYRLRGQDDDWLPVDERQLNSIMNSVQDQGGVFCLKSLVSQRIKSVMATDYHPVHAYLDSIRGTWDGRDRVGDLCSRISKSDYCHRLMRVWLRAMVAQWLGINGRHANAVMLLLISPQQGLHKSTFLHELLPEQLSAYYTDDFTLSSKGNAERKLVEFALVNIDEFDKLPTKKMPDLKTLMQTLRPSFVKAYKTNFNQLPRIASFVGTSNERHVLTDRTGSRRFLILEPDGEIRVEGICHDQLYAQLIDEIEHGQPYYFNKQEEAEMHQHNQSYYKPNELETLFAQFFDVPIRESHGDAAEVEKVESTSPESTSTQLLSAAQLMERLRSHNAKVLREVSETTFVSMLHRLSVPIEHRHYGNLYRVVVR